MDEKNIIIKILNCRNVFIVIYFTRVSSGRSARKLNYLYTFLCVTKRFSDHGHFFETFWDTRKRVKVFS